MTDKKWEKIRADVMCASYNVDIMAFAIYQATWGKTINIRNEARRFAIMLAKKNGWKEL